MFRGSGTWVVGAEEDRASAVAAERSKSGSSRAFPRGFCRTSVMLCLGALPRSQAMEREPDIGRGRAGGACGRSLPLVAQAGNATGGAEMFCLCWTARWRVRGRDGQGLSQHSRANRTLSCPQPGIVGSALQFSQCRPV